MGSIGTGEILLIFLIALLLFGPGKLPELGKALGRAVREFKRAETEVKDALAGVSSMPSGDPDDDGIRSSAEPEKQPSKKPGNE